MDKKEYEEYLKIIKKMIKVMYKKMYNKELECDIKDTGDDWDRIGCEVIEMTMGGDKEFNKKFEKMTEENELFDLGYIVIAMIKLYRRWLDLDEMVIQAEELDEGLKYATEAVDRILFCKRWYPAYA